MILVHVDHDRGAVDAVSLQAITLARSLDSDVQAVIMGGSEFAPELGEYGASTVHVAEHPGLTDYAPQATARAITGLIASLLPAAVLGAGTARGNEVLAHVAAMTDLPFAADCTEITLGSPVGVTRARWGGNLLEESTVITTTLLATVFAHAIPAVPSPAAGTVTAFTPELSPADLAVVIIERAGAASAGVTLAEAKVVVSGGRGMGGPESFSLLEDLAGLLGGTVGCSRVVTSAGWRPHAEQVGQTGTKIAPDLYIACGISGATQHLAGCKNSKTLIAINTDPDAPIMLIADYAIVGDVHAVLPQVIALTRAATGA